MYKYIMNSQFTIGDNMDVAGLAGTSLISLTLIKGETK